MNLETKITIYKFTPQLFTLTRNLHPPFSLYYSQKQDFHSNVLELSYYYLHLLGNNY